MLENRELIGDALRPLDRLSGVHGVLPAWISPAARSPDRLPRRCIRPGGSPFRCRPIAAGRSAGTAAIRSMSMSTR